MPPHPAAVSFGLRYRQLAERHPEKKAVVLAAVDGSERCLSWGELESRGNQAARLLASRGVGPKSLVAIALPSCFEHYIATLAAWRLGACVLPMNPALPDRERDDLLELATSWRPTLVIANWSLGDCPTLSPEVFRQLEEFDPTPVPDTVPHPGKAIGSGGSTGRSKIIVDPKPFTHVPGHWGWASNIGIMREGQVQLVTGKLHHNLGFYLSHAGLFEDHTLVLMEHFEAAYAVELIERYHVSFAGWAPIVMQRIARLPDVRQRDFSSIEGFYHSGGPCPNWVKRVWVELVPAERQWNAFGSAEDKGLLLMSGAEWLEHPDALGHPLPGYSEVKILDDEQREVPVGAVGEIYMRLVPQIGPSYPEEPTYEYIGSPPAKATPDGFTSVGDLGYLDTDGWVYLADRRVDMIVSGGANVYPAEVESALSEHTGIADVVVVGLPDEEWGRRVHAVIEPCDLDHPPSIAELDAFIRARLVTYKAPKSYEFLDKLPRESSGKIRRSAIADARRAGGAPGILSVRRQAQE